MSAGELIKIVRDVEVVQIPEGHKIRLARNTEVRVMQALGDTFTLMTEYHTMVRLEGQDADAIGRQVLSVPTPVVDSTAKPLTAEELTDRVWHALRSVFDPEIPVNVVDLGLVYKCEVKPVPEGFTVLVDMTLTAPGCGMGHVLKEDAERRIKTLPQVKEVFVGIVVEPPWDTSRMSDAAKLELGLG